MDYPWLRWELVGLIAVGGAWWIVRPNDVVAFAVPLGNVDEQYRARVERAVRLRRSVEALPKRWSLVPGVAMLALAAIASVLPLRAAEINAVISVGGAALLLALYAHLRGVRGLRVAPLRVRRDRDVVPWYVFASAEIAALCPLAYADLHSVSAITITAGSSAIVAIAWTVGRLPTLNTGEDRLVEQFVDDWMRRSRAVNIAWTGASVPLLYLQLGFDVGSSVHLTAVLVAYAAEFVVMIYSLVTFRPRPNTGELRRWASDEG